MCTPLAFQLGGALFSFIGQIQQARAAQAQANFQAAVARNNAIIAQRQAEDARLRGEQLAEQISIKEQADVAKSALDTRRFIAHQRVAQAALGQATDVGSAADLVSGTVTVGKLDELTLRRNAAFERQVARNNAEREAIGFLTQGFNFQAEARLASMRASAARSAGLISAFGTIITTAGLVSARWKNRVPTVTGGFNPVISDPGPFSPSFTGGFT